MSAHALPKLYVESHDATQRRALTPCGRNRFILLLSTCVGEAAWRDGIANLASRLEAATNHSFMQPLVGTWAH